MNILNRLIFIICLISIHNEMYATHNRAGEITYVQTGPLSIKATITTYTKASASNVDRDSLFIFWGDGNSELLFRSNGKGEEIPGEDIKINYYSGDHIYPGRGKYTIGFADPNRVNNIQNVNYPNSVDVPFYVETQFTLIESQFQGPNNSVRLLQPPIDFACVGQRFLHNPNAFDIDGDSINYKLVVPLQAEGLPVPNYNFPDQIGSGNGQMTINNLTGDLVWDVPNVTGEFNVAIQIDEYRQGVLLNSVIRDMQILVLPCPDNPPVVEAIKEICVIAGTTLSIPVRVTDIDSGQMVRLSATGGPFEQAYSPAVLNNQFIYSESPLENTFRWETKCERISDSYYQVVFRGQDDSKQGVNGNSVLKNLRIKVVGPPPLNLTTQVENDTQIKLSWDQPYICENTFNDYFIGFRVYRRLGTNPFIPQECDNGLEGRGYEVIKFLTTDQENDKYVYTDTNVDKGDIYCYRVLANFANRTSTGQPFQIVEGLASEEVCTQLKQDIPLITEVSVLETSATDGQMSVSWLKPKAADLDTIIITGPYSYKILQSTDNNIFEEVGSISSINFGSSPEVTFIVDRLNTRSNQYNYQIDFYNDVSLYSSSKIASSVFSNLVATDRQNLVACQENVPWRNTSYFLEERDSAANNYVEIDQSDNCDFAHNNLENETEYCYRIKTIGTYGLETEPDSIINYSQIVCGVPLDTVGPCPPIVEVTSPCTLAEGEIIEDMNKITWAIDKVNCDYNEAAVSFNVYFAQDSFSTDLNLIAQIPATEVYLHEHIPELGISGCYHVTAFDALGNEGPLSAKICVDNCPIYNLPNAFTPNGDGTNDLFRPRKNKFVAQVEFKLFNRWGNLLYETLDPELNWNGNSNSGKEIPEGTYFYTCKVLELGIDDDLNEAEILHGYIQLIR